MSKEAEWDRYDGDIMPQGSGKEIVIFHYKPKRMEKESERQGLPVYKDVLMVKIILPADSYHIPDVEVKPHLIERYQAQYDHFIKTQENRQIGTPIEHWYALSDTQKATFKAMNIMTVENFADLSDERGAKIMGFNALREKAKMFVASGRDAELIGKVRAEAEADKAVMQAQIDEMKALIEGMTAPKAREKAHA